MNMFEGYEDPNDPNEGFQGFPQDDNNDNNQFFQFESNNDEFNFDNQELIEKQNEQQFENYYQEQENQQQNLELKPIDNKMFNDPNEQEESENNHTMFQPPTEKVIESDNNNNQLNDVPQIHEINNDKLKGFEDDKKINDNYTTFHFKYFEEQFDFKEDQQNNLNQQQQFDDYSEICNASSTYALTESNSYQISSTTFRHTDNNNNSNIEEVLKNKIDFIGYQKVQVCDKKDKNQEKNLEKNHPRFIKTLIKMTFDKYIKIKDSNLFSRIYEKSGLPQGIKDQMHSDFMLFLNCCLVTKNKLFLSYGDYNYLFFGYQGNQKMMQLISLFKIYCIEIFSKDSLYYKQYLNDRKGNPIKGQNIFEEQLQVLRDALLYSNQELQLYKKMMKNALKKYNNSKIIGFLESESLRTFH